MSNSPAATSEPRVESPPSARPKTHIETNWFKAGFGMGIGFWLAGLLISLIPIVIVVLVIGAMIGAATHTGIP